MAYSWSDYGILRVKLWHTYGQTMAYLRSVYGILMVRLCHTQGQTMAHIGSDYGKLRVRILGYLRSVYGNILRVR